MKRTMLAVAVLALWCGAGVNFANAQGFGTLGQNGRGNPFVNPNTGPFQRGGFNTYGIIRPPFDTNPNLLNPNVRLNPDGTIQGPLETQGTSPLGGLQTGHAVTYFNYSHYYPLTPDGGTGTTGIPGFGGFGGIGAPGYGYGNQLYGQRTNNPTTVIMPGGNSGRR